MMKKRHLGFWGLCLLLSACTKKTTPTDTWFQSVDSRYSGVTFNNQLKETESFNIIEYLYYYNGGGVATGDLNNDGLSDIFFTGNQVGNRLYLNQGDFTFEDATEQAGVACKETWNNGVTLADINQDGLLDIYVCQLGDYKGIRGRNQLFINQGNALFKEEAQKYGLDFQGFSTQAAFFDYDRDGDLDLYLLNHSIHDPSNYRDTSQRAQPDALAGDRLYRNDNQGFVDVSQAAGIRSSRIGFGLGIAVADLNNDGCDDLYVSNDFHENDYLYYNNCDGTFREDITQSMGHTSQFSMGSDVADFNNDGRLDVLTLDMKPASEIVLKNSVGADPYDIFQFKHGYGYHYQYPRNMLQLNMGQNADGFAYFSEVGQLTGMAATDWSWSALFADFDNDGWKDVFISNGILRRPNDLDYLKFISNQKIQDKASDLELAQQMPDGKMPNYLFKNEKQLHFSSHEKELGDALATCSTGAAYADFDNDGDLDLVVNNINAEAFLLKNTSEKNGKHFLRLRLENKKGMTIGAKVCLYAGGLEQLQQLSTSRGFMSASEAVLHFGLDTINQIDSLRVQWPNGETQLLQKVAVDQILVLKASNAQPPKKSIAKLPKQQFTPQLSPLSTAYRHRENQFYDINREKLMPYLLSTQGPAMAVADVNGDGLDDVFLGGAKQQRAMLLLQDKKGNFASSNQSTWSAERFYEDVDAQFFDADNDGDVDLYVVSAGNEFQTGSPAVQDRLYRNDGRGKFTLWVNALPEVAENSSCVRSADFDGDGDLDLFVGGRSRARAYGAAPLNYLLENDGKGRFREVTATRAPALRHLGMVTDAVWSNIDQTTAPELIVVGEWMPITIFRFEEGVFSKETLPDTEGWWQSIDAGDFDGDGDADFIAGNIGLNHNLSASKTQPLSLYLKDFDQNMSTDPILAYYRDEVQYPYASKDELVQQLVALRKKYPQYRAFSKRSFEEVFTAEQLQGAKHRVAKVMATSYFENRGNLSFERHAMPREVQFAPVMDLLLRDFDGDGFLDVLMAGNFHEVQPSIGRMDASYGWWLRGDGTGQFSAIYPEQSGWKMTGQVRQLAFLTNAQKEALILVARNDASVLVFRNNE